MTFENHITYVYTTDTIHIHLAILTTSIRSFFCTGKFVICKISLTPIPILKPICKPLHYPTLLAASLPASSRPTPINRKVAPATNITYLSLSDYTLRCVILIIVRLVARHYMEEGLVGYAEHRDCQRPGASLDDGCRCFDMDGNARLKWKHETMERGQCSLNNGSGSPSSAKDQLQLDEWV